MPQAILFTGLAFACGALLAVQAPTNAILARASGSPLAAAIASFVVGIVALTALWLASGAPRTLADPRAVPWYAWIGGLYGAAFVASSAVITPRIGVAAMLTMVVAGQLLAAMALDHFGLMQLPARPASLTRVAGVALVFAGALLVRRG